MRVHILTHNTITVNYKVIPLLAALFDCGAISEMAKTTDIEKVAERKASGVLVRSAAMGRITNKSMLEGDRFKLWDYVGEKKGREFVKDCVALIRTIEVEKHPLVVRAIVKFFKMRTSIDALVSEIEKVGGVDGDRASLIAADQLKKLACLMQVQKWKEAGWKRVMWKHATSGVKEPRPLHIKKWDGKSGKFNGRPNGLNGYIFDINKPPVIDADGTRGFPGWMIGCSCYLVPYDKGEIKGKGKVK